MKRNCKESDGRRFCCSSPTGGVAWGKPDDVIIVRVKQVGLNGDCSKNYLGIIFISVDKNN